MKTKRAVAFVLLAAMLLALPIVARTEALSLQTELTSEYMTIESIEIFRAEAFTRLRATYRLHEVLSPQDEEALASMLICIMQDAESLEIPAEYLSDAYAPQNPELEGRIVEAAVYVSESDWLPLAGWPQWLVLRPLYRATGEWGAAFAIEVPAEALRMLNDDELAQLTR